MKSEYILTNGSLCMTNTHIYEKRRLYSRITEKLIPFFIIHYGGTKVYEVALKLSNDFKIILLLFLFVFLFVLCLGIYLAFEMFFKSSWKTKINLNDIHSIDQEEDDNETDLKIKLRNNKKVLLSFRTLEKEHLRFIEDLKKKKSIYVKQELK